MVNINEIIQIIKKIIITSSIIANLRFLPAWEANRLIGSHKRVVQKESIRLSVSAIKLLLLLFIFSYFHKLELTSFSFS